MTPLPRLLLLTNEPPHSGAAGAIAFLRLLQDYPPESLLVISNQTVPAQARRLGCRYEHLPLAADRLKRTRASRWRPAWRALGGSALVRLGRVATRLRGFRPQVVVTLMQDSWFYDLAARYARAAGLPLVLFVHDLPSAFEPVAPWLEPWQRRRDMQVYRQASVRLCVSPAQVEWLRERLGADGDVLPPPRSTDLPWGRPEEARALKTPGRLTLGYAGGLHYGYGEQLLALLPVLRETGTRLEVFAPPPAGSVAALRDAGDVLVHHGHAPTPEDAWRALAARCDAVLQPYLNPPGDHALQYRTHFPSKLGDCLSLALPVLMTGPVDAAGVAWCRARPHSALLVTDPAPATLARALVRLRDDPALRVELARGARAFGEEFDAPRLRALLHARLRAVAHPSRP